MYVIIYNTNVIIVMTPQDICALRLNYSDKIIKGCDASRLYYTYNYHAELQKKINLLGTQN